MCTGIRKYKHGRNLIKNGKRGGSAYKSLSWQTVKRKANYQKSSWRSACWLARTQTLLTSCAHLRSQLLKTFPSLCWKSSSCAGTCELVRLHRTQEWHITYTALDARCGELQAPVLPLPAGVRATSVSWGKKSTFMYKSVTGLRAQEGNKIRKGGGGSRFFSPSPSLPWSHANDGNFSPRCSLAEGGKGTLLQFSIKSSYREQEAAASLSLAQKSSRFLCCSASKCWNCSGNRTA